MNDSLTVVVGRTTAQHPTGLAAPTTEPTELEIDPARVRDELSKLVALVAEAQTPSESQFEIAELELHIAVTGTGRLSLLGLGAEATAETSMKVIIRRKGNGR